MAYSSIELTDLFGRRVLKRETDKNETEVIFDISSLNEGYYIVSLNSNETIITGKFLKKLK
jgi:hypothetical protein